MRTFTKQSIMGGIIACLCLLSCMGAKQGGGEDASLDELYQLMQGWFDSSAQAAAHPGYHNISLRMYPIWERRKEGKWLYVEQAASVNLSKPYRQRVYHLSHKDGVYRSEIFKLPNEEKWVGAWEDPSSFDALRPADLEDRAGCAVYLKRVGEKHYKGGTHYKDCESSLQGAAYATSEVEVTDGKIMSWDQGFDKDGKQMWGAEDGGYEFIRKD